ncbi:MAG TPA: hypothetical protein VFX93_12705, partial [Xanthomonadaceae bacterium]|nr:hypothetical protein [Xanthomonadaceae bacterium]
EAGIRGAGRGCEHGKERGEHTTLHIDIPGRKARIFVTAAAPGIWHWSRGMQEAAAEWDFLRRGVAGMAMARNVEAAQSAPGERARRAA